MKKLIALLLSGIVFNACQSFRPKQEGVSNIDFEKINEQANYDEYLNMVIALQSKGDIDYSKKVAFPVKFHVVRPLLDAPLYTEDFTSTLNYLNKHFSASNIEFSQDGVTDYIYSETPLDQLFYSRRSEMAISSKSYDPSVLNIYVMHSHQEVLGFTHYPQVNVQRLFISKDHLQDASLIHEIGHYFGLLHTFDGEQNATETSDQFCELSGDKICDTPADISGASFVEGECTLYGEYKDAMGNTFTPDLSNYMSYYGSCRNAFSREQSERMYFIAKKIKLPQMRIKA